MIGGNFEDGFVTGVFSRGFNDTLHANASFRLPRWAGKLLFGEDYIAQGGAIGIAVSYPGFTGGKYDAGVYVEGHAGGEDYGIGRTTLGIGVSSGDVQGLTGQGNELSASYGGYGGSIATDDNNNVTGFGAHIGAGYNIGGTGTLTTSFDVRDGIEWLKGWW